jgi:hypothetical protein
MLPPGTYKITARTRAGAAPRPVVVVIEPAGGETSFACGRSGGSAPSVFDSMAGAFGSGPSETSPRTASAQGRESDRPDSGVLPAVTEKLKDLPKALPRPGLPSGAASPPWIIGAGALILVALSLLALLAYVIRFIRGPRTT